MTIITAAMTAVSAPAAAGFGVAAGTGVAVAAGGTVGCAAAVVGVGVGFSSAVIENTDSPGESA